MSYNIKSETDYASGFGQYSESDILDFITYVLTPFDSAMLPFSLH